MRGPVFLLSFPKTFLDWNNSMVKATFFNGASRLLITRSLGSRRVGASMHKIRNVALQTATKNKL